MSTLLELIKNPGSRRFGLVVQGGGMRGVYTAGVLACFDSHGLQDSFISVSGSSAGAMNAAYFLAHQPGAINVYINLLSNKNFIDFARKVKRIDIDYMVDVALHQEFPINFERLREAKSQLDVVLTDADTGEQKVVTHQGTFKNIYEEFRATSAIPVLYDRKIPLDKHYFVDGGVSDLIPVDVALVHKPTDVIVIMSKPLKFYTRRSLIQPALRKIIRKAAKYQSFHVRDILPTNEISLRKNIALIRAGKSGNTTIWCLYPQKEIAASKITIDRTKLESAGEQGWGEAEAFLAQEVLAAN